MRKGGRRFLRNGRAEHTSSQERTGQGSMVAINARHDNILTGFVPAIPRKPGRREPSRLSVGYRQMPFVLAHSIITASLSPLWKHHRDAITRFDRANPRYSWRSGAPMIMPDSPLCDKRQEIKNPSCH